MNIGTMLADATLELAASGSDSARLDADVLLMHSLGIERARILSHPERTVSRRQQRDFSDLIERRKKGEPVSYILGKKEFWSLDFKVTPDVLIPRPETECLIEEVLRHYSASSGGLRICDIGTGSGIIAIALAKELPGISVSATDISPDALAVATDNAIRHGVSEKIVFFETDILAGVPGNFDVICSNPPYISEEDYPSLPEGIRHFEPKVALLSQEKGLAMHRKIIAEGAHRLNAGGRIFIEIGEGQKEAVASFFGEEGVYCDIACRKDYSGTERVVSARRV
jgi:release factor glutamine methyltransferase